MEHVEHAPMHEGLLDVEACIQRLFPTRPPTVRTFKEWMARGWIPYKKVGRLTFFDPFEVRAAIDKRFSVKALEF